jgi:predicted CXXCH cytochrome family protein
MLRSMSSRIAIALGVALPPLLLALGAIALDRLYAPRPGERPDFGEVAYVGSEACFSCHRDRHATWYATFHRTMTQEATPATVLAPFDGRVLDFQGVRTRLVREGPRFFFEFLDPESGRLLDRAPVVRTVGSRRYQQYLGRDPDRSPNHYRLQWLWHREEQRFVHLNAAFLGPDGEPFDAHLNVWEQNCIFCHNTGPKPGVRNLEALGRRIAAGERLETARLTEFDAEVAELGIACEACHAPGARHVEAHRDPLRRLAYRLFGWEDPTIVNPARLDALRSAQVCGQCHAQRLPPGPEALARWLELGPSYRPGDDLHRHAVPLWPETPVPGQPDSDLFALRFWPDRTPRLTAYEYQGLLLSSAHLEAGLTCIACHAMHGGDPRGMIEEAMRGPAACADCHAPEAADPEAHARHRSPVAEDCYACHMPRIVYGVMEIHKSHRIESPAPLAQAAADRPNACNLCHLDRSPGWAQAALDRSRDDGSSEAEIVAALHRGDPLRRAVALEAAGRYAEHRPRDANRMLVPHLLLALEDPYPSSRRFARRSLLAIGARDPALAPLGETLRELDWMRPLTEPRNAGLLPRLWELWRGIDKSAWPAPHDGLWLQGDYLPDVERVRQAMVESERRTRRVHIGE